MKNKRKAGYNSWKINHAVKEVREDDTITVHGVKGIEFKIFL